MEKRREKKREKGKQREREREREKRGGKMSRSQAAGRTGYIRTSLLRQNQ